MGHECRVVGWAIPGREGCHERQSGSTGHHAYGGYARRPSLIPRRIKPTVDEALTQLSPTFDRMYAANGRASIPPEHLLKACLLMALFSVRSERQFCDRLEYDLLFQWFLDLNIMDHGFDHSVFAKNRQRLLDADVARECLLEIVAQAREQRLLSKEHFSPTLDQSGHTAGSLGIGEEFPAQRRG